MSDFDNLEPDDSFYSVGDNTSKQPEKEENGSQNLEQDITASDNLESEPSDPPEEELLEINFGRIEISRRSGRAKAPRSLYPGQITHGSASISRRLLHNPDQPKPNLATLETSSSRLRFTSTHVAQ